MILTIPLKRAFFSFFPEVDLTNALEGLGGVVSYRLTATLAILAMGVKANILSFRRLIHSCDVKIGIIENGVGASTDGLKGEGIIRVKESLLALSWDK